MSVAPIQNYYRTSKALKEQETRKQVVLNLPPAHPKQFEFINLFASNPKIRFLVGACGTKWGKLLWTETPVPTPAGWSTIGQLKEGDYVFDADGVPTLIDYITNVQYGLQSYRVKFSDGSEVLVDAGHLWETETHLSRKAVARVKSANDRCKSTSYGPKIVTTQEIKDTLQYSAGGKLRPNHSVAVCGPVQFNSQNLELDPYVLGYWLGDGTTNTGGVTCSEEDATSMRAEFSSAGFTTTEGNDPQRFGVLGLAAKLREVGVLAQKHVPSKYLIGSVEQRLHLLQGLMDSDGTIGKNGICSFDNTNKALADSVESLTASLGIKVNRNERYGKLNGAQHKLCYRVQFTTDLPVFRLKRKLSRIRSVAAKTKLRYIVAVEEILSLPMRCLRVQSPRHLFLVGKSFIPTHNTYGCTIKLTQEAWNNVGYDGKPLSGPGLYWWVAPSYDQSKMAYALVKRLLPPDTFEEYKSELKLTLKKPDGSDHSIIQFKSGDNPDTLRGFAVNFVIIDEGARIPEESFVSVLTTLTQTRGKAIIISTPNGRGWFYDAYQRGEKNYPDGSPKYSPTDEDPWEEWMSIRMPTWHNPHVAVDSIREMRKNLPEDVFHQEVGAQFLSDSAGVFRGITECLRGSLQPPLPGHTYVVGVDLARKRDYSVLTVMDRHNMHVVHWERFNKISWELQYHRMIQTAKRYNNALLVMDSTGLGDPIVETVKSGGVRVEGYTIGGSKAKQQLIEKLRLNVENHKISFPESLPILRRELENYEYSISEAGIVRYSAPQGQHDDCVISLALANWGADQPSWVYVYSSKRGV